MEEGSEKKTPGLLDILGRFLSGRKKVTEAEIQEFMDAGEEEGLINEEENAMIRSILALGDSVVREIMLPRTEMACVTVDELSASALGHHRLRPFPAPGLRGNHRQHRRAHLRQGPAQVLGQDECSGLKVIRPPFSSRRPRTSRNCFTFKKGGCIWRW